jgi:integrase/recombinase XerD
MQLQRWSGLSLVDGVCLSREELVQTGKNFRIDTNRRKTGTHVQVPIPSWLGRELLRVKNGNAQYVFQSGQATTKSATSIYDTLYRTVFKAAGVPDGSSHRFRHRFAVALLESGVDIRVVSRALGHKSLAVTERFYAAWSQKQQQKMEQAIAQAWK